MDALQLNPASVVAGYRLVRQLGRSGRAWIVVPTAGGLPAVLRRYASGEHPQIEPRMLAARHSLELLDCATTADGELILVEEWAKLGSFGPIWVAQPRDTAQGVTAAIPLLEQLSDVATAGWLAPELELADLLLDETGRVRLRSGIHWVRAEEVESWPETVRAAMRAVDGLLEVLLGPKGVELLARRTPELGVPARDWPTLAAQLLERITPTPIRTGSAELHGSGVSAGDSLSRLGRLGGNWSSERSPTDAVPTAGARGMRSVLGALNGHTAANGPGARNGVGTRNGPSAFEVFRRRGGEVIARVRARTASSAPGSRPVRSAAPGRRRRPILVAAGLAALLLTIGLWALPPADSGHAADGPAASSAPSVSPSAAPSVSSGAAAQARGAVGESISHAAAELFNVPETAITVVSDMGQAVLVRIESEHTTASALLLRTEAGWKVRDVFD